MMIPSVSSGALVRALALACCLGPLAACDDTPDTPGQALDQAIQHTGEAVKRAGDGIKDAGR